jgi:hypothetical protein
MLLELLQPIARSSAHPGGKIAVGLIVLRSSAPPGRKNSFDSFFSYQQDVMLLNIGNFVVGTDHLILHEDVLLLKIGNFLDGTHHLF